MTGVKTRCNSDMMAQFEEMLDRKLDEKLGPIKTNIASVARDVKLAIDSATEAQQVAYGAMSTANEAMDMVKSLRQEICHIRDEMSINSKSIKGIQDTTIAHDEQLIAQECYSRRNNLLFDGVPESPDENLHVTMATIISKMDIDATSVSMIGCHRVPSGHHIASRVKPRPVIIKFLRFEDRKRLWSSRHKSSKTVSIREDYPQVVQRRRQALWPYMKAAHQGDPSNPSGEVNAYLRVDKLFINNQKFTHDMTSSIPAYITDRVNNPPSMKCNDETTVFFTKTSPLSNFHASTFKVDDQNYKCVEQYLSYKKAMLWK